MEKKVIDYLKLNSEKYGEKDAVVCGDSRITFEELYEKTVATATKIVIEHADKRVMFAVENKRSIETIVLMLSVVVSGKCYRVVNSLHDNLSGYIVIDESYIEDKFLLDGKYLPGDMCEAFEGLDDEQPMFEICTSGTTGEPKKIVKNQRDLLEFIIDFADKFGINEGDVFLNQLEFTFDASTKDIYSMVVLGATLYIATRKDINFPAEFVKCLKENSITVFITTPFFIKNIARLKGLDGSSLSKLKYVMFVGENMKSEYLNYWIACMKNTTFINLYGSSELAGNSLYYIVRDKVETNYVPLKECFLDYEYGIEEGQLVLGRESRKLTYKTGDMTIISDDGDVFLIGRCDNIRKIRGYRISLESVENEIERHSSVKEALCEQYEDNLYVLFTSDEEEVDIKALHKELQQRISKFIQPLRIVQVKELPVNANGKQERKKIMEYFV